MSYQEELLIRIRSAYEGGGFSSLTADMSKAKSGYNQVANTASGTTGKLNQVGKAASSSFMQINYGAKTGTDGINKISTSATQATNRLGQVATAGSKAGTTVAKGGEVGAKGLDNVSKAGSGAISTLDGLNTVIGGIIGGFGLMTIATAAWSGSSSAEFNKAWLATKVGTEAANQYVTAIQKIVSEVPGDDSFMNQLLTSAVTKQTSLTTAELKSLGSATADYLTESQRQGKSAIETQMDLKEYIASGNTTQLERDSILKGQIGTLQGQGTVSERILALNKALTAEGLQGISATEATALTWEEVKGKLQASATTLGTKFLPYISRALDFVLQMDEKTGGVSTQMILIGGAAVAAAGALGLIAGPIKGAVDSAKDLVGWIKDKIPSTKTTTVKCVKDPSCTGGSGGTTTSTKTTLSSLKSELAAIFAGTSGGAALSGAAIAVTFIMGIVGTLANYGLGYYIQSWINSQDIKNPFEKLGIDAGMALIGGLLPGISNAFRQGSAAAGNSFLQLLDSIDLVKMAQDKINADLGNLKIQLGGVLDWGNWIKAPGQIMEIVSWLNKVICAVRGCSPGIIPSLQLMQIIFIQVFNAIKAPITLVWNTLQSFVSMIISKVTTLGSTVTNTWNAIVALVSVWIATGISVATGAIDWAISVWNSATGTIGSWIGTGVSVATNAIQDAISWWNQLKTTIGNGINTVINVVTTGHAGSPTEIDYLYGQGSYYEPDYTPIVTSTPSATPAVSSSTTSKIVISEGAVKVEVGSIDSSERVKEVENAVTMALSGLNDSKGR